MWRPSGVQVGRPLARPRIGCVGQRGDHPGQLRARCSCVAHGMVGEVGRARRIGHIDPRPIVDGALDRPHQQAAVLLAQVEQVALEEQHHRQLAGDGGDRLGGEARLEQRDRADVDAVARAQRPRGRPGGVHHGAGGDRAGGGAHAGDAAALDDGARDGGAGADVDAGRPQLAVERAHHPAGVDLIRVGLEQRTVHRPRRQDRRRPQRLGLVQHDHVRREVRARARTPGAASPRPARTAPGTAAPLAARPGRRPSAPGGRRRSACRTRPAPPPARPPSSRRSPPRRPWSGCRARAGARAGSRPRPRRPGAGRPSRRGCHRPPRPHQPPATTFGRTSGAPATPGSIAFTAQPHSDASTSTSS